MKRLSPALERIFAGVGLCLAFVLMASIFAPDRTQAEEKERRSLEQSSEPSTDPHAGLVSLGTIEDDQYVVHIFAGETGPLYSVYDAADGRQLGLLLNAEEVAEWFPQLPIPSMGHPAGPPISMADPEATGQPTDP